jgi:cell division protein FtsL
VSGATATVRAVGARQRNATASAARPADRLRLVRRRRSRALGLIAALVILACVFGALKIQVSLIDGQQRLDSIRRQVAQLQVENEELSRAKSQLESPAKVGQIAQETLGMVQANTTEVIAPSGAVVGHPEGTQETNAGQQAG